VADLDPTPCCLIAQRLGLVFSIGSIEPLSWRRQQVLKKLEYFPIQYKVNLALENKEKREKELAEQSVHWETFKKPRPKVR
jgi:hypothetical protein